jgi:succinylglutamate desuccinylase
MKIILNIGTHGDEMIGFKVEKEIKKLKLLKGELVVNIANPKAVELRKRFIESDLNRSFPGNARGTHEEKLSSSMLPLIKSADIVIDIHSTTSELKDALIVTRLNKEIKKYIDIIGPKYLLYMTATKNNALISNAKVGIAFEYGKDKSKEAIQNTVIGIKRLLLYLGMIADKTSLSKVKTRCFNVFKTISKPKDAKLQSNIRNYSLVRKGHVYASYAGNKLIAKQDFYPILFGERNYKDIFGFAGKLVK